MRKLTDPHQDSNLIEPEWFSLTLSRYPAPTVKPPGVPRGSAT
jgi:hypothetical protein